MDGLSFTEDRFFGGRFVVVQPAKGGHRAGTDALLVAAAVPDRFAGTVADFGAGCGTAGLAVLIRCHEARALLVENSPATVACARATLAHPDNARLAGRATLVEADVTLAGPARRDGGLADRSADFVIMNPPFNDAVDRASPNDDRRAAHVMGQDLFEAWLKSAAALLKPRGTVALIARPASLGAILAALERRFGAADILPVLPRADRAAIRIVVRARLGSRGALGIWPPLVLHEADGGFTPRMMDINAGRAGLFEDLPEARSSN